MTNSQKILNMVGIANKAKKTAIGYDSVIKMITNQKASLILVAKDASENTKNKFINKCYYYNIVVDLSFSTNELNQALGRGNAKVVAICDVGLVEAIKKLLKEGVNYES